jgi:radical SAM superfamily enzyme YgiQ (UPF0313 family)
MRILLINTNRYKDPMPVMPMGLCRVAASLENAGHVVEFLDLCFSLTPGSDITREVDRFGPDIVGVSIRNIDTCNGFRPVFLLEGVRKHMVAPLKQAFAGPVVLGGATAGINGPELLSYLDCEYAVQGDGEHAMVAFADRIRDKKELSGLPGLIIRRAGGTTEANAPDFPDDLDSLPVPDPRKYLNMTLYRMYNSPLPVQTKRGCAMRCAYCTYNRLEGHAYRLRSPSRIADEIEAFVKATGIRSVEIVDSTFNAPLDHAKNVLREIIFRRLDVRLSTMGLNPRHLDEELAGLMKQAGFIEACFGIEAMSSPMLKSLAKNFTVDDIKAAARIIRTTRIPVMWYLIIGAPGETVETIRETFSGIARIASPLDFVNIAVGIRVYNGAPIAETWAAEHHGAPADNFFAPVAYQPGRLTPKKLKAIASLATALHHNFFMFDDKANVLLPIRLILSTFFPGQPLWRGYVVMRLFEKYSGVFLVRALVAWVMYRFALKR